MELLVRDGIGEADPLVLMPARIVARKNIELGIEVIAAARGRGRPAGLLVTGPADPHERGEGDYLRGLRRLARERGVADATWFPGADADDGLPQSVLADLYALADVAFLPSRDEGFGIPVLEAALWRLPLVVSDLPVLREVGGDAPVYIDPDDPVDRVMDRLLERLDRDPVARLARRARREASWETVYRTTIAPLLERAAEPR
jgi:glycosyltransferase involved in cell wall biosynthesis